MNAVGKKLENTYKQENKFRKTYRLLDAAGGQNEQLRTFLEKRGNIAMVNLQ